MRKIRLLDCTLRDGAQTNEARFGVEAVKDIASGLTEAGIDIVECGFLKDCEFEPGRTYYPQPSFAVPYIPQKKKSGVMYAALVDFNRYDIEKFEPYDGRTFELIRVSLFEKDVNNVKDFVKKVIDKGYKVSIQPMDTFSYSEENIRTIIEVANELNVEMLAMVDTYSLATEKDLDRVYPIYRQNLKKGIKIGFHSHNNQLNSYALARHFIEISEEDRDITLDSSLYGMGRGGGNLNTELISEYFNRQGINQYEMKPLLDLIDNYISKFKEEYRWGYSLDMLYAGLYGVHVFTTAYLLQKPGVSSYDLKCMFEMLDEHKKKRYDYDYLDAIYETYMEQKGKTDEKSCGYDSN